LDLAPPIDALRAATAIDEQAGRKSPTYCLTLGQTLGLTPEEQNRNIRLASSHREITMSEPSALSDISRYEQACDQAIAMCDGNMRSTIKALIMANEYLENELQELQMAASNERASASPRATSNAA
jgi:hypothetical protein